MKTTIAIKLAACLLLAAAPAAQKKDPDDATLARLKKSMSERYATLERLRDERKVGERTDGHVAVVKSEDAGKHIDPKNEKSPTIGSVVAAENSDRKTLYGILAKRLKTNAAAVGRQNGIRNIKKADPTHWIYTDGKWIERQQIKAKKKTK